MSFAKDISLKENESVPGAFFEYTYNHLDKFVMVAGGRVDFHNLYGTQWTPRLHLRVQSDRPDHLYGLRQGAVSGYQTRWPNTTAIWLAPEQ